MTDKESPGAVTAHGASEIDQLERRVWVEAKPLQKNSQVHIADIEGLAP
jgi:hypothetical protein